MALKKREPMQFAPPSPCEWGGLISEPPSDPEPMVKLGVMIYKSLNKRLNLEAANREVKSRTSSTKSSRATSRCRTEEGS
jgi:hypothetical protein